LSPLKNKPQNKCFSYKKHNQTTKIPTKNSNPHMMDLLLYSDVTLVDVTDVVGVDILLEVVEVVDAVEP